MTVQAVNGSPGADGTDERTTFHGTDPDKAAETAISASTSTKCQARTRLYRDGALGLEGFPVTDISEHLKDPETVVWLDLRDPDREDLDVLRAEFGLHEVAVEDALFLHERPKLDRYRHHLLLACRAVKDARVLARIKALVIPPAWEDVWICRDAAGHIQAVGTDSAGRRQYRYHDLWREHRDRDKHDRMLEFGRALPGIRDAVRSHLGGRGLSRDRVLAAAISLIDLGFFRPGGDEYAAENGTFGLATIGRRHVTCHGDQLIFDYLAKGSKQREQAVADDEVCAVVRGLKRRRWGGDELFAYRSGREWHDVAAEDLNDYLRELSGGRDFTVKDFRTWHATVLAAVGLAVSRSAATSEAAGKRAVARVVREVADYLGNTPAVARASYIDPHVIEVYERGKTIAAVLGDLGATSEFGQLATQGEAERAVLRILAS